MSQTAPTDEAVARGMDTRPAASICILPRCDKRTEVWLRAFRNGIRNRPCELFDPLAVHPEGETPILVTMERPAPIRSSWVTLRVGARHNAEPHAKEPVMNTVRFIGLDVHAETIAVDAGTGEGQRPREDGSLRRREAGPQLPRGGLDGGVGARRQP
jgi:hypothetical protein